MTRIQVYLQFTYLCLIVINVVFTSHNSTCKSGFPWMGMRVSLKRPLIPEFVECEPASLQPNFWTIVQLRPCGVILLVVFACLMLIFWLKVGH